MFTTESQSYKCFFIIYMIFLLTITEDNIFNYKIFIKEYVRKENELSYLRGLIYSFQITPGNNITYNTLVKIHQENLRTMKTTFYCHLHHIFSINLLTFTKNNIFR